MMSQIRYIRVADSLFRNRTCLSYMPVRGIRRCYSTAPENPSKEVAKATPPTEAASSQEALGSLTHHRVNKVDKLLLVWGKKYKSTGDVPNFVSQDTMERARNKARIKINIMMAVATLFGCMLMIMSGKKAQKKGESVAKMNEEWHKQIKEEAKRKEAAASVQDAK